MLRYNADTSTWDAATPEYIRYRLISTSRYTQTIGGVASVITMSSTADFGSGAEAGWPVQYMSGGVNYYGVVTAISVNTSITVAGPGLAIGASITGLRIGTMESVHVEHITITGAYGDGTNDLLATDMKRYLRWGKRQHHLVYISAVHNTAAGTTQPKVNVKVAGSAVSTMDTNNGLQLSTAGTWVHNTLNSIHTSNYVCLYDSAIEVTCTVAGNPTGGALDLTVRLVFVEHAP
jgi:hypothetical protein